ncbi:hypothetical protein MHBO_001184 [Bonamia ostreae]|uniref:Mediator of RNA polymerase II transcription subunit 7 n=1 Tax=Bonamia ostreae TaxID=126728 RepID=A0ABV2AIR0_9EUKA
MKFPDPPNHYKNSEKELSENYKIYENLLKHGNFRKFGETFDFETPQNIKALNNVDSKNDLLSLNMKDMEIFTELLKSISRSDFSQIDETVKNLNENFSQSFHLLNSMRRYQALKTLETDLDIKNDYLDDKIEALKMFLSKCKKGR